MLPKRVELHQITFQIGMFNQFGAKNTKYNIAGLTNIEFPMWQNWLEFFQGASASDTPPAFPRKFAAFRTM